MRYEELVDVVDEEKDALRVVRRRERKQKIEGDEALFMLFQGMYR